MSKVDFRKKRSQEKLQSALIELLQKKSFDDISIEQLCETANVSRQTFYSNYQNKQTILSQRVQTIFTHASADCATFMESNNHKEYITYCLQTLFNACVSEPLITKVAFANFSYQSTLYIAKEFVQKILSPLMNNTQNFQHSLTLDFLSGAILSCLHTWLIQREDERSALAPVDEIQALILSTVNSSI